MCLHWTSLQGLEEGTLSSSLGLHTDGFLYKRLSSWYSLQVSLVDVPSAEPLVQY